MNDIELETIETAIRRSTRGHEPAAPDRLVRFIDSVPARVPKAGRVETLVSRRGVRRSALAIAACVAIVAGLAGGAALMSIRTTPSPQPAAAPALDWTWQHIEGARVTQAWQVADGYIGSCVTSLTSALCTSRDAVHWQIPADAAVISIAAPSVPQGSEFNPSQVVHVGKTYLMLGFTTSTSASFATAVSSIWRSTDGGVTWAQTQPVGLEGLLMLYLVASDEAFMVSAASDGPTEGFASSDGLNWTRVSPPDAGVAYGGGDAGFVTTPANQVTGHSYRSADGRAWSEIVMSPAMFYDAVKTPTGYVGTALLLSTPGGLHLLQSADGTSWRALDANPPGYLQAWAHFPDRLVASTTQKGDNSGPNSDWESTDWGKTWRPLIGPDGNQMTGAIFQYGDRLGVWSSDNSKPETPTWVGTLAPVTDQTPAPSAVPSGAASDTPAAGAPTETAVPSGAASDTPAVSAPTETAVPS
jgi:hypothetical protein